MNTNISLAYLKLKQFSDCVQYCNKALKRRKTMPGGILEKTLYRKAAAECELGDFESSKQTCKDLLEVFPGNAAAAKLLDIISLPIGDRGLRAAGASSALAMLPPAALGSGDNCLLHRRKKRRGISINVQQ